MSVAASKLELERRASQEIVENEVEEEKISTPRRQSLDRLAITSPPPSSGPVVAVDLDDVLSQTNHEISIWHNEMYGTNMDLSTFYYYYYWKNPYWGSIEETFKKVQEFYATDRIYKAAPVPGAREGIQSLHEMGYRLIIVTARAPDTKERSWEWVNYHFPGFFHSVICTGQFKDAHKKAGHEVTTKLSKAQVCRDLKAQLLIDDSSENAIQVATAAEPTPVLLFGDYPWNKRMSSPADSHVETVFETRLKAEGGKEFWKLETLDIPPDAPLRRTKDWAETVRWIRSARARGEL